MKKMSKLKFSLFVSLPVLLHFCMSSLYGVCRRFIMDVFGLATFDPEHFDANDLTRWYFALLALSTIGLAVFISVRYMQNRKVRTAVIGILSVILFYMSELFCQGMMFK